MGDPEGKERLLWAEALKVGAVYAVILVHSSAPFVADYGPGGPRAWWAGNVYDSASRWCIPVFVMLSGFFLIEKYREEAMGSFFMRRFMRVFVPFIAWSLIYFIWRVYANDERLSASAFVPMLFMEPAYYHLWYMYLVMGLYLVAPLMGLYMKNSCCRHGWYYIGLWFCAGSVLPFVESWFGFTTYITSGTGNSLFKFTGYFALGWMLRDYEPGGPKKLLLLLVFLLGFAITAYGTYFASVGKGGGEFNGVFYEYFSFSVLMMSVPLFLIAKGARLSAFSGNPGYGARAIRAAAACVPGIYLVHAMLIAVFKRGLLGFDLTPAMTDPFIGIPLFALAVFLASLAVVLVIRSLPVLRNIVPAMLITLVLAAPAQASGARPIEREEFKTLTGFSRTPLGKMDELEAWKRALPAVKKVSVESTADGSSQKALFFDSGSWRKKPLIIVLHSWSEDYRQSFGIPYGLWAEANDWVLIQPDYRGPFDNPAATLSEAATRDILDSLEYAKKNANIDPSRVYLAGFSGGAMAALAMAGRYPDKWAGVVSWGAVYDLVDWFAHTKGASHHYSKDIAASCGGPPEPGTPWARECEKRSPSAYLRAARGAVPVFIAVGIRDSFVPPSHSLEAFNDLADENGRLTEEEIETISKGHRLPGAWRCGCEDRQFEDAGVELLHQRESGKAVLKIYDGKHDVVYNAGLSWLAGQKR